MTLVVEDGTGLSTAEAYASVAEANAYWADRNSPAAWTASTDAQKEAALRMASAYLDLRNSGLWRGSRYSAPQRLAWPRSGVVVDGVTFDVTPLPRLLKEACIEAALKQRTETAGLLPDDATPNVTSESVSVGSLSKSATYAGGKSAVKRFTVVENLVAPLISFSSQLERA